VTDLSWEGAAVGDRCLVCGSALIHARDTSDRYQRVAAFLVAQEVLEARARRASSRSVIR
jgi:hypothetical protein